MNSIGVLSFVGLTYKTLHLRSGLAIATPPQTPPTPTHTHKVTVKLGAASSNSSFTYQTDLKV